MSEEIVSEPTGGARRVYRWRVVDIVVASVLAVAAGLVFVLWNIASNPIGASLGALLPGLQALLGGGWLFAGVLTALVIRKPGAALYGELVAATVSALVGNQWGVLTLESGLVQGLAAELVFAVFLYRVWNLPVAVLSGAAAGLALAVNDLILWYPGGGRSLLGHLCRVGGRLRRCPRGWPVLVSSFVVWRRPAPCRVFSPAEWGRATTCSDERHRRSRAAAGSLSPRRDGTGVMPVARSGR